MADIIPIRPLGGTVKIKPIRPIGTNTGTLSTPQEQVVKPPIYDDLGLPVGEPRVLGKAVSLPFTPVTETLRSPGAITEADAPDAIERKEASILDIAELGGKTAQKVFPGGFTAEDAGEPLNLSPKLAGSIAREATELGAGYLYAGGVVKALGGMSKSLFNSNWWRRMTIPERQIVTQAVEGMKDAGMSEGQILRSLSKQGKTTEFEAFKKEAIAKRAPGRLVKKDKPLGEIHRPRKPVSSPGVIAKGELPRHSDSIKEIQNLFKIPIRVGRHPALSKKALGIYKVKPEVIRLRMANDIEVAAHEAGHHIQKVLGFPEQMPAEVQAMAYSGADDTSSEGFAEFVRVYLTRPDEAKKMAPKYFKDFEASLVNHPDVKSVFDKVSENWQQWEKLPSQQKVMSYIRTGSEVDAKKRITFNQIYTHAIDEYRPLQQLTKEAERMQGKPISVEKDPFKRAALSRGWARKAEQFLKYGTFTESAKGVKFTGKSLKKILKSVNKKGMMEQLDAYLVARRALSDDRIVKGFRNQLTRADFRKTVNEGNKKFQPIANELYTYQTNLLSHLVESGRLSQEAALKMIEGNLFYAPLYRVMDAPGGMSMLGKKGLSSLSDPIKRLKGSSRDIISPTENMVYNTFFMLNVAEKNRVGRAIADLSEIEGMGRIIEKVPQKVKPIKISQEELKRLKYEPLSPEEANDFETIFRPSTALEPNEVVFYKNGKPQHYIIGDKDLYNAINSLDQESTNMLIKALAYPAKWLRTGATLSPEFIMRNPIRDQMTAFVFSKYGYKPFWDAGKGMFNILGKTKLYQQYNASGAAHAALVSLDRDYVGKGLQELLKSPDIHNLYKKPLRSFQIVSELMEEATRVGEFGRALRIEGETKEGLIKSGLAARDVTLDFARIGAKTKAFNAITAFFNAQVQGSDKIARAFKEAPGKTTAKAIGGITIPSVLLWSVNKDDKYYQELPNWRKVLFWNFIFHKKDGSLKQVMSIPKPFELGIMFGSAPEMALNWAYKKDKTGMEEATKTMWEAFAPGVLPTVVVPPIENFANKSIMFDRPIVPRSKEGLSPALQFGPRTSETMKLIGKGMGKVPVLKDFASPAKLENLFRGWTGNLGYLTLQGADKMLKTFGITEPPTRPTMTLADIPGIRGFAARFPSANSKSIEDFYRKFSDEERQHKDKRSKNPAVVRLIDVAKESKKGKKVEVPEPLKSYRETAKTLSILRKIIATTYEGNATPKQKRLVLDRMHFIMIDTARKALGKEPIYNKKGKLIHRRQP